MGFLLNDTLGMAGTFATLYDFISKQLRDDYSVFINQLRKNINVICGAAINAFTESPEFKGIIPPFADEIIYDEVVKALVNKKQLNVDEIQKKLDISRRDILDQLMKIIDLKLQESFEYSQRDYNAWSRQKAIDIELSLGDINNEMNLMVKNINGIPQKTINLFKEEFATNYSYLADGVIIPPISKIGRQPRQIKINRDNPYKFNSGTTKLIGREYELDLLIKFINAPNASHVVWWTITGTGGTGKSRLVYTFANELLDTSRWRHAFFTRDIPLTFTALEKTANAYPNDILIVIDNDISDLQELAKWISWRNNDDEDKHIRVLILQRLSPIMLENQNPPWWRNFTEYNEDMLSYMFSLDDRMRMLKLSPLTEEDLVLIAESYAVNMFPDQNPDVTSLRDGVISLLKIDPLNHRPLYLMIIVDAIMRKGHFSPTDEDEILNYAFLRELSLLRKKIKEAFGYKREQNSLLYKDIETTYAEAIIANGASISLANRHSGLPKDEFIARCNQYGISENGKALVIEPDLLGEYYVVRYAENIGGFIMSQEFWQRLFRDNYRLLNKKYKNGFEWLLRVSAHLIDFYYKGLFEAFLDCGDLNERKYIRTLMDNVFSHLGDEWLSKHLSDWDSPDVSDEYREALKMAVLAGTGMMRGLCEPEIHEMKWHMDNVIAGKYDVSEVPKLHKYEPYESLEAIHGKEIYSKLAHAPEEELTIEMIADTLNEYERLYQRNVEKEDMRRGIHGENNKKRDLEKPNELAEYHAFTIDRALVYLFTSDKEFPEVFLSEVAHKCLRRLRNLHEKNPCSIETEIYVKSLMLMYDRGENFYKSKLDTLAELEYLYQTFKGKRKALDEWFDSFYSGFQIF